MLLSRLPLGQRPKDQRAVHIAFSRVGLIADWFNN